MDRQSIKNRSRKGKMKNSANGVDKMTEAQKDKDTPVLYTLQGPIEECNDQRLRALLMLFRKSSNIEKRITIKDLSNALQEMSIKIPSKDVSDLAEQYTDQYGIDFERLYKYFQKIQSNSNLDSAKVKRIQVQTARESESNLLQRIANEFQTQADEFDKCFSEFKDKITERCTKHRSTMLSVKEISKLIETSNMPLYGAVLKAIFDRSSHSNNLIDATKFIAILEEASHLNVESRLKKTTDVTSAQVEDIQSTYTAISETATEIQFNDNQTISSLVDNRDSMMDEKIDFEKIKVEDTIKEEEKVNALKTEDDFLVKVKLGPNDEVKIPINNHIMSPRDLELPELKFDLDWIYGYSGTEGKQNLVSVPFTNEIAYSAGSVIVLYNLEKRRQRHFREHASLVKCICLYLNGFYLLSASVKTETSKQMLKLWRADNLKTIKNLAKDLIQGSIVAMCTSKYAAEKVVVVDEIDLIRYQIVVLDINKDVKVASVEILTTIIDIGLNPKEENYMITIGKEHLGFWKLENNKIVESNGPNYERNMKALFITSYCFKENGDLITGDSNGNIYIWSFEEARISHAVKHGHEGSILSIVTITEPIILSGRDNKVYGWSLPRLDHAGALRLPRQESGIKILIFHKEYIVVATKFNSLYYAKRVSNDANFPLNGAIFQSDSITEGHTGEISQIQERNLSAHDSEIISCRIDGVILTLKPLEHEIKYRKYIQGAVITSIDFTTNSDSTKTTLIATLVSLACFISIIVTVICCKKAPCCNNCCGLCAKKKIFEDEDKENHKAEASEFHVALPSAVTNASFNNDISNILATTPLSYRMDMHENDIHPNEMFVSLPGVITHENT